MKDRILILTAGYGEGHNAAARALHVACEALGGAGSSRLVDVFAVASPRFHRFSRSAYLDLIHFAPRVWSAFYQWVDRHEVFPGALHLLRKEMTALEHLLLEMKPAAICSTYPVYGFMIDALRRKHGLTAPHFNIVTDSITINSLWRKPDCAGWFVPNQETAEVMRAAGVSADRICVSGFPVDPFFADHLGVLSPPDLDEEFWPVAPRVLYLVNSGTRHVHDTVRRLLEQEDWDLTVAVGRNENLRRSLAALARGRKRQAVFLGWTHRIPELLLSHHVAISKAGGATTQEAIAARCPLLVNQIIPGQEEGNYELLRRHAIGAYADSPEKTVAELRRAFADGGQVWSEWRKSMEKFGPPNAARQIARYLWSLPTDDAAPTKIGKPISASG